MPKYTPDQIQSLQRAWWVSGRIFDKSCQRCGVKLTDMAGGCTAQLDDPCPGFASIEAAEAEFFANFKRITERS